MDKSKKRTLIKLGLGFGIVAWILRMDFYINAWFHIICASIIVLGLGIYALLINHGIISISDAEADTLKAAIIIWCISIIAACLILLLQLDFFSSVSYLLIIYRIISSACYGLWAVSWMSLWWVGKKLWLS